MFTYRLALLINELLKRSSINVAIVSAINVITFPKATFITSSNCGLYLPALTTKST
ncbi:hypothetical protein [Peribacillus asahii]|uniref:hypothetical protein n=1 Tax=Peribacillus asahii TaxID=228899 RepID=UPI0020795897|nr:hypothetical protein [Peribacillus asahii]USK83598.1 hypothetical protein LIT35_14165 [Peribacillus asahii]